MRRVLVGMPGYQGLTPEAACGFFGCTKGGVEVRRRMQTRSALLAHNHNLLWCEALNGRRGGVTHFAMQHSDVEPEAGWLDTLLAELDRTGLDVVGVPVPLKDERGLTSTAVARDDGDPWRVARRLTLTEVHALPETFTSDDVGGPLLLNTGLWACRLDDWAEEVWFEINDRIAADPDGVFAAVVEPEDWHFSRQLHRLGVRAGCTRKVRLAHRGPVPFTNARPWGQPTDADNLEANAEEVPT
jgi:hypothetical protein